MSYRELTMTDVREVLRRWQAGQSARQMSREGVAGRATAARYIEAAQALGLTPQSELSVSRAARKGPTSRGMRGDQGPTARARDAGAHGRRRARTLIAASVPRPGWFRRLGLGAALRDPG